MILIVGRTRRFPHQPCQASDGASRFALPAPTPPRGS